MPGCVPRRDAAADRMGPAATRHESASMALRIDCAGTIRPEVRCARVEPDGDRARVRSIIAKVLRSRAAVPSDRGHRARMLFVAASITSRPARRKDSRARSALRPIECGTRRAGARKIRVDRDIAACARARGARCRRIGKRDRCSARAILFSWSLDRPWRDRFDCTPMRFAAQESEIRFHGVKSVSRGSKIELEESEVDLEASETGFPESEIGLCE